MNDFLVIRNSESKVKIENKAISAFRSKDIGYNGARLFTSDDRVISTAHIGEIDPDKLLASCEKNYAVGLVAEGIPRGSEVKAWRYGSAEKDSGASLLDEAKTQIEHLEKHLPNFVFNGQITKSVKSVYYRNALGKDLRSEHDEYGFHYDMRRKGSPNIADGFFYHTSALGFNSVDNLQWIIEVLSAYDQEVQVPAGRHKVLMTADARALSTIGESLSANSYFEGSALYSGRLGSKIFSDKFSLSDLKDVPERQGLKPFDYEGTVASDVNLKLMENGVPVALISDLKNEKRHGVKSTGNGFRNFNSSVKLGFANLALSPGVRSYRDILRDAGTVIISVMAFGGDLTAQGDFSTPIQLAFLAKDGVIQGRLPALAMNSHLEKMFGDNLLEVAKDGEYMDSPHPFILSEMDIQII